MTGNMKLYPDFKFNCFQNSFHNRHTHFECVKTATPLH